MDGIIFMLILFGPGVVLFVAENILLRVTRQGLRPWRFLSLLTLLIPLGLAVREWRGGGLLWGLGVFLYLVMVGTMLFGWLLAYCEEYARSRAGKK